MNTLKTVFLMTFMMVLLMLLGEYLGGSQGLIMALAISLLMNFGSYWFSDRIVLMMYRAKEVTEAEAPRLYSLVARVSSEAQLPMPRVYIIPGDTPNAFATGRGPQHAAVAATEGILNLLTDDELEGVLAHEFSHIKHRDILTGTIVATMVGTITFVARMAGWAMMFGGAGSRDRRNGGGASDLALMILAPIAAVLVQLAISRSREFAADEGGAHICGRPLSLANALQKLERGVDRTPMTNASPATAHMFIVNPLSGGGIAKLFSTHPPLEERIERLQKMAMGGI
ncbi:MAG TPA: zinc metalloprotease HtpX [Bacteroidota bacterium]|nr:zinc metalloprotease HtpX [Bacteroidota bacterium]